MNILLTFNENYAQHAAACMTSICENNRWDNDLHFYLLVDNITEKSLEKFSTYETIYGCKVSIQNIHGFMSSIDSSFDTSGWNEIVMARLLMARYLPESVDKILYLDGDTIIRSSLRPLWDCPMSGNLLGAVIEPTVKNSKLNQLGVRDAGYFNAGVLLVDIRAWREQGAEQQLLEICRNKKDILTSNDQDALNLLCAGNFKVLSPTYNYANTFDYYPYEYLSKLEKNYPFPSKSEFAKIKENPCIVHYLGEDRPWRTGTTHRFQSDYWHYAAKSPFSGSLAQEAGWETYFSLWKAFNGLFCHFPPVRLWIIQSLIPVMLKLRSKSK